MRDPQAQCRIFSWFVQDYLQEERVAAQLTVLHLYVNIIPPMGSFSSAHRDSA